MDIWKSSVAVNKFLFNFPQQFGMKAVVPAKRQMPKKSIKLMHGWYAGYLAYANSCKGNFKLTINLVP